MRRVTAIFGLRDRTVDEAEPIVTTALGVTLEARWSDFLGGEYWTDGIGSHESLRILDNASAPDLDDRPYPDLSQYAVIVEVSDWPDGSNYVAILKAAGFEHLAHREFEK